MIEPTTRPLEMLDPSTEFEKVERYARSAAVMLVVMYDTPSTTGPTATSAPTMKSQYLPVGATLVPLGPRPGLPFE